MKVKSIKIENLHNFRKFEADFDENVTYLIGDNGAGKTTAGLNSLWFIMQGIAEKSSGGNIPLIGERFRFIGNSGASAKGELILFDEKTKEEITVLRKMTKDVTSVSFEGKEGMKLDQAWLNNLFNLFLISPQAFSELSSRDQARQLGIDTSAFDKEIVKLKNAASDIRAHIKAIGLAPPVAEVISVDIAGLNICGSRCKRRWKIDVS